MSRICKMRVTKCPVKVTRYLIHENKGNEDKIYSVLVIHHHRKGKLLNISFFYSNVKRL